ncbi:MAG: hypothetical protein EHM23_36105 [Acidobacteria bacterium]|nr:MAG: hypothetical protein EHM23_36105 [Acidobacteriota bacterium]
MSEVSATPAAVDLAAANEVDLEEVEGTGSGGKITVDDVRTAVEERGDDVIETQTLDPETAPGTEGDATTGVIGGPTPSENLTPEQLPGDVDVEDLDDSEHEGEHAPLILAGYWVRLGVHEAVDEEFVGAIASVVESPWTNAPWTGDTEQTISGYYFDEEKDFLVKLRGSNEAIIEVPAEAIAASAQDRPTLLAYA